MISCGTGLDSFQWLAGCSWPHEPNPSKGYLASSATSFTSLPRIIRPKRLVTCWSESAKNSVKALVFLKHIFMIKLSVSSCSPNKKDYIEKEDFSQTLQLSSFEMFLWRLLWRRVSAPCKVPWVFGLTTVVVSFFATNGLESSIRNKTWTSQST